MKTPAHYARKLLADPKSYLNGAYLKRTAKADALRMKLNAQYAMPFVRKRFASKMRRRVAVFPTPMNRYFPAEIYVAWKTLRACGATICGAGEPHTDLAIAWNPSTQYVPDAATLERMRGRHPVVNAECTDIRKSRVGEVFGKVFGYRLEIDPLTYDGTVVRKSERNGPHDATLLEGPLERVEPGYVYQRLIDFRTPHGMTEWRVLVVAGRIVRVYANCRPIENRFVPVPTACVAYTVEEAFDAGERANIEAFAHAMRLDFGALDVLRDERDGRIYVCDCNNTPTGPSSIMPAREQVSIVRDLADAFEAAFFR